MKLLLQCLLAAAWYWREASFQKKDKPSLEALGEDCAGAERHVVGSESNLFSDSIATINGPLKSSLVKQRRGPGMCLEDAEHGGLLDIGDATGVHHTLRELCHC